MYVTEDALNEAILKLQWSTNESMGKFNEIGHRSANHSARSFEGSSDLFLRVNGCMLGMPEINLKSLVLKRKH